MNCNKVRRYFYAFLDGELDVEKNIEVLSHLNMCHACGIRIEKERVIQKRVKETVCKVTAPASLEQKILKNAKGKPKVFDLWVKHFLFRNKVALLSGLAAALLLIMGYFVLPTKLKKEDILYLTESRYHDYLMKGHEPDIHLPDAESVMGRFYGQTGLAAILPGIEENVQLHSSKVVVEYLQQQTNLRISLPGVGEGVQIVGASVLKIKNMSIPVVYYLFENTPITVAIVCNANVEFKKMKETMVDKMLVHTGTGYCGACQIVGWKEAGNQYVMISTLKSDKLLKIITKV